MSAEGLESLFPIEELAVMGLVEVLPRAFSIMHRMSETAETIGRLSPDAVVTINAPPFANGVWRHLGKLDTPLIHYVASTVWAWRARRARKLAGRIDHLLALLPFEPPCFEAEGLGCTFVGHPGLETEIASGAGAAFRARHGMEAGPAIGLLPGSRSDEISRLMPVFADAIRRIAASVTAERKERHAAMAACDTAIAASGSVALELALARAPMVVAYRFPPLTASVMRRMIRVRYATIVNLILDRPAIPEFLQERCTGSRLAEAALELLRDEGARRMQREAAASAIAALRPAGRSPSTRAAEAILDVVRRRSKARTEQGAFA